MKAIILSVLIGFFEGIILTDWYRDKIQLRKNNNVKLSSKKTA